MVRRVSIGELKVRCGRLIDECDREGELCIVTRRGKPVGVLVPWGEDTPPAMPAGQVKEIAVEPAAEPSDGPGGLSSVDAAMDSATWGQWSEMSDEDRAAMVLAQSLVRGSRRDEGPRGMAPGAGWGALADRD